MKKLVLALTILAASLTASAADRSVSATLARIEMEKNAKCTHYKTSKMSVALVAYKWHKEYYTCVSNEGMFDVALKVRTRATDWETGANGYPVPVNFSNGVVTKIIYK